MNRFKQLRLDQGLSQLALANLLNVHQTAVSQWETGRTQPDNDTLIKLSVLYHVSVDYLLGRPSEVERPVSKKDKELEGIEFALFGEVHELTDRKSVV